MLIVNDEQRLRAGIGSISKRCQYCSKALAAYPLILSDDAKLAVYHAVDIPTQRMVNTSWHSDWRPTPHVWTSWTTSAHRDILSCTIKRHIFESQDLPEKFNRRQAIYHFRAVPITSVRALPGVLAVQAAAHLR